MVDVVLSGQELLLIVSTFPLFPGKTWLTRTDGFAGADKVFLFEFSMPMGDKTGFNADMPAIVSIFQIHSSFTDWTHERGSIVASKQVRKLIEFSGCSMPRSHAHFNTEMRIVRVGSLVAANSILQRHLNPAQCF